MDRNAQGESRAKSIHAVPRWIQCKVHFIYPSVPQWFPLNRGSVRGRVSFSRSNDGDDSQNISGLYGGRMFWNVAPFRIVDEFDVFMDMELAAFEVVILTPDQF